MIKHVIFDLGDVMVNVHPERALQEFAVKCRLEEQHLRAFYLSEVHLGFMEGRYSPDEFFKKMMHLLPCDLSREEFVEIWNHVIGSPKDGIEHLVSQLNQRYTLSVCSNTDPWHWKFVYRTYPFIHNFQHFFLSFKMRMNKPNPSVFSTILDELNVTGKECVFIDDTPENVRTAGDFGIHGIVGKEPGYIRKKLEAMDILP